VVPSSKKGRDASSKLQIYTVGFTHVEILREDPTS
jgi:hypothetical protein